MNTFSLDNVKIASPCLASWADMKGDERARFCALCSKHVYNLSAMSRPDAEALIQQKEGKACVRFFRRRDGTMLTSDCPVGLRAWRRKMAMAVTAGFALILGSYFLRRRSEEVPETPLMGKMMMGEMSAPAEK